MQSGDFRHKITIQTRDDRENWNDYITVHARVNSVSGSEYWQAAAIQAEQTINFDVRYQEALKKLTPQMCRIVFNGNRYDIQSIDDFEFRHNTVRFKGVMHYGRNQGN